MRLLLPLLLIPLSAAACQSDTVDRMQLEGEPVSFAELKGYTSTTERNATVFTSTRSNKDASSIVIRTVRMDERSDRTPEEIVRATQASLEAMPKASVSAPTSVDDAYLEAMQFDVSFEPRTKPGKTYERRHVVLFGDDYAFHVLHTAPKGRMDDLAKDFRRVVETLREES